MDLCGRLKKILDRVGIPPHTVTTSIEVSQPKTKTTETKNMSKLKLPFGYEAHPHAELLPLIDGKEAAIIKESIAAHGVKNPIVLFKGKVLDGRNRLILASEAGIKKEDIPVREFDPATEGDPLAFVRRENLERRHLTQGQLGLVAAGIAKEIAKTLKDTAKPAPATTGSDGNSSNGQDAQAERPSHQARKVAAKIAGVSEDTVKQSQKVDKFPDLAEKVKNGGLSLNAAAEEASRRIQAEKEKKQQGAVKEARAAAIEKLSKDHGEKSQLVQAIKRGSKLKDPKELAIFTDLPKAQRTSLIPLVISGTSVKDAVKITALKPGADFTLTDLINYGIAKGGLGTKTTTYQVTVGAYTFTVAPTKDEAKRLAESVK